TFAVEPHRSTYVHLARSKMGVPQQMDRDQVLSRPQPLQEDPTRRALSQNAYNEIHILAPFDLEMSGVALRRRAKSYVLHCTGTLQEMDSLALKYLGTGTTRFEDIAGKGAKQLTFDQIALEHAAPYAAEDADITLRLHRTLWPRLEETGALASVF